MATNDWKTELKRRIKDIKDKKKNDDDIRTRAEKYKKKVKTPTTPAAKPGYETKVAPADKLHPLTAKPIEDDAADAISDEKPQVPTRKKSVATGPSQKTEKDYGEELFEVDPAEDEGSVVEKKDTEAIVKQLSRISTGKLNGKTAVDAANDDVFLMEEDSKEPTLFPVSSTEAKRETGIEEVIKNIKDVVVEDRPTKVTEPTPPSDNLDEALDSYIPVESVDPEEKSTSSELDKRVYLREPTVVDKTQQSINLHRLGAAFTDLSILAGIEIIILWISSMIVQANPFELLIGSYIKFTILFISLHFIYYVLFTSVSGQTPGKSIFGIKVVKEGTKTIGIIYGTLRWLLIFVSLIPLGLGYLTMFITKKGQALHDMILKMRVEIRPDK